MIHMIRFVVIFLLSFFSFCNVTDMVTVNCCIEKSCVKMVEHYFFWLWNDINV